MRGSYAVVWREGEGPLYTGKLELGPSAFRLEGTARDGTIWAERLRYEDLASVRIGRGPGELLGGRRVVVLERRTGGRIRIASLDGLGIVHELADQVAELASDRAALAGRLVVVVPLRARARERARALLEEGPPFDPETMPLERHHVFVTEREVVFLFEGAHARALVDRLLRDPSVWRAAAAWRACLGGRPRLAEEAYAWVRASDSEDLSPAAAPSPVTRAGAPSPGRA